MSAERPAMPERSGAVDDSCDPLLSSRGLGLSLGGRAVLHDIDFSLARGEMVGLIGPNGAGKTTLLRALARLLTPDRGAIRLAGTPLPRIPPPILARRLGYLAQGADTHWPLTVAALVALGRTPHLGWWQRPGERDWAAVERALQLADVLHLRHRRVDTLSGGERLRVMLARVFATEPELILADEPVASLDPYHQLQVMEILREHAGRGAVVVVLHDLNLAARFCDRLVLLEHGRVVAAGPVTGVLNEQHLRQVYGIEAQMVDRDGEHAVIPWRRVR